MALLNARMACLENSNTGMHQISEVLLYSILATSHMCSLINPNEMRTLVLCSSRGVGSCSKANRYSPLLHIKAREQMIIIGSRTGECINSVEATQQNVFL